MNKKIKSCWEFWGCEKNAKNECPVFIEGEGNKCWLVAGSFCVFPSCPMLKNKYDDCCDCLWYKENNPECMKE